MCIAEIHISKQLLISVAGPSVVVHVRFEESALFVEGAPTDVVAVQGGEPFDALH